MQASHWGGLSRCRARAPGTRASVVVARGLSSCGARAELLRGMWDLPGPGLKPVSTALAGGLPTAAPSGKPSQILSKGMDSAEESEEKIRERKEYQESDNSYDSSFKEWLGSHFR